MTPETPQTTATLIPYEYGAMSSKYRLLASHKLTAYATMVVHYERSAHMLVIYSPEESKEDIWANLFGQISERLDEIFGGEGAFEAYLETHHEEIFTCYSTIEQLV